MIDDREVRLNLGGGDIELSYPAELPDNPLISVWMITYNHASYIKDALDSVLMQNVDFDYEICLGEDGSNDGTREICLEYARKYPHRIRLFLRDRSNPARARYVAPFRHNGTETRNACRGKYIAMLEGDDFWTSPDKLAKQAHVLNRHPELSCCAHNAVNFDQATLAEVGYYCPPQLPAVLNVRDMLVCDWVPTCSVMFRRGLFARYPEWYFDLAMGDWPLHLLNMRFGDMGYDPQPMAVYRIHPSGAWSGSTRINHLIGQFEAYRRFDELFERKYRRLIRRVVSSRYYELAMEQMRLGRVAEARQSYFRMFHHCPYNPDLRLQDVIKCGVRLFAPAVYSGAKAMGFIERQTAPR